MAHLWYGALRYSRVRNPEGVQFRTIPFVYADLDGTTQSGVVNLIRGKSPHDELIAAGWKEEVPDVCLCSPEETSDVLTILVGKTLGAK